MVSLRSVERVCATSKKECEQPTAWGKASIPSGFVGLHHFANPETTNLVTMLKQPAAAINNVKMLDL
jgi:hypothetical protein